MNNSIRRDRSAMNSKERVHKALNRVPVDRVPVFMWFHPDTAALLAKYLGIAPHQVDEAMGNDVRQVWVGNNYAMEGIVHEHDGETHSDAWGITWVRAVIAKYGIMAANKGGKAKTLTQTLALIMFSMGLQFLPNPVQVVAWVLMWAALILTVVTGADYLRHAWNIRRKGRSGQVG